MCARRAHPLRGSPPLRHRAGNARHEARREERGARDLLRVGRRTRLLPPLLELRRCFRAGSVSATGRWAGMTCMSRAAASDDTRAKARLPLDAKLSGIDGRLTTCSGKTPLRLSRPAAPRPRTQVSPMTRQNARFTQVFCTLQRPLTGTRRVRLVRGEGRGVSD